MINSQPKTRIFAITALMMLLHQATSAQDARSITRSMFNKTKSIKTLSYVMTKKERFGEKMEEQRSFVKLNRKPLKVYTKQLSPDEGIEVLYIEGDKTALINPNGFPWFNVRLDPMGGKMTNGQHHTIFDSGFDRFINVLVHLFDKYGDKIAGMVKISEQKDREGNPCWLLEFENPNFGYVDYQVKADEDLLSIGYDRHISAYLMLQLNDKVDDYFDVKAGQTIKIPNDYSPKMSLLINKELLVPEEIKVYINNELFEHYQFSDIVINPSFKPEEFTEDYKEYGF